MYTEMKNNMPIHYIEDYYLSEIKKLKREIERKDMDIDRAYVNGMKAGWNYGLVENKDGLNACIDKRRENVRIAKQALNEEE